MTTALISQELLKSAISGRSAQLAQNLAQGGAEEVSEVIIVEVEAEECVATTAE